MKKRSIAILLALLLCGGLGMGFAIGRGWIFADEDTLSDEMSLEEVLNMDDDTREAFIDRLEKNGETFDGWLEEHQEDVEVEPAPWEQGGKTPDQYTLEEYLDLNDDFRHAFEQYFGSKDAFHAWLDSQTEAPDLEEEDLFAGRTLEDFTFDDYFEMDMVDQAAFCEAYFDGDEEALFAWLDSQTEEPDLDE